MTQRVIAFIFSIMMVCAASAQDFSVVQNFVVELNKMCPADYENGMVMTGVTSNCDGSEKNLTFNYKIVPNHEASLDWVVENADLFKAMMVEMLNNDIMLKEIRELMRQNGFSVQMYFVDPSENEALIVLSPDEY